jgi:hypothetical protein
VRVSKVAKTKKQKNDQQHDCQLDQVSEIREYQLQRRRSARTVRGDSQIVQIQYLKPVGSSQIKAGSQLKTI